MQDSSVGRKKVVNRKKFTAARISWSPQSFFCKSPARSSHSDLHRLGLFAWSSASSSLLCAAELLWPTSDRIVIRSHQQIVGQHRSELDVFFVRVWILKVSHFVNAFGCEFSFLQSSSKCLSLSTDSYCSPNSVQPFRVNCRSLFYHLDPDTRQHSLPFSPRKLVGRYGVMAIDCITMRLSD